MKPPSYFFGVAAMLGILLTSAAQSHGQGTIQWTVTFDGPPYIRPNDVFAITNYSEQGMVFTPIEVGQRFGRSGGAPVNEGFPRNGTAYLIGAFTYSLAVKSSSGTPFGLVSVDLAEFSTLYAFPAMVQFVGYRPDGSTITTNLVTDGVIDGAGPLNDFETFYFDSRFVNLVRVEVPTYGWSLDNMVFSDAIPEPGIGSLLVVGAGVLGLWFFKRKRRLP